MTILDACVAVLSRSQAPMSGDEIYEAIARLGLYKFQAKDPKNIVKSTLRKHLRSAAKRRVVEVQKGLFKSA